MVGDLLEFTPDNIDATKIMPGGKICLLQYARYTYNVLISKYVLCDSIGLPIEAKYRKRGKGF